MVWEKIILTKKSTTRKRQDILRGLPIIRLEKNDPRYMRVYRSPNMIATAFKEEIVDIKKLKKLVNEARKLGLIL